MSDFGILLSTGSGNPFITPASIPMSMYGKYTVNSSSNGGNGQAAAMSIPWNDEWPAMVFVKSTQPGAVLGSYKAAGRVGFSGSTVNSAPFTVTAYVFGIFPQTPPQWGLCVWDDKGEVILTNETRVLTDLVTVGTVGVNGQSGVTMDITLAGSYAVCPKIHGSTLFQNLNSGTGQPIIVNVTAYTSAAFDGSSTRFTAALTQYPGGNPVGNTDTMCDLVAINTAAYDN